MDLLKLALGMAYLFLVKMSFDVGFKQGYTSVRFDIERHDTRMRQCIETLAQR